MKNFVTSVCSMLLALLIFYGGAGINYITYCCNDCRSEGIDVVVDKKCCEIHDHNHLAHEHDRVTHTHEHGADCVHGHDCEPQEDEDCCGLERVDFEWDSTPLQIPVFNPLTTDLLCFQKYNIPQLIEPEELITDTSKEIDPPLICPRVYLSLLTTLLI